jgi:hypothetical protein
MTWRSVVLGLPWVCRNFTTDHLQLHERKPVRLEKCVLIYCAASTGEAPAANRLLIRLAELFASTTHNIHTIGTRMIPMPKEMSSPRNHHTPKKRNTLKYLSIVELTQPCYDT